MARRMRAPLREEYRKLAWVQRQPRIGCRRKTVSAPLRRQSPSSWSRRFRNARSAGRVPRLVYSMSRKSQSMALPARAFRWVPTEPFRGVRPNRYNAQQGWPQITARLYEASCRPAPCRGCKASLPTIWMRRRRTPPSSLRKVRGGRDSPRAARATATERSCASS